MIKTILLALMLTLTLSSFMLASDKTVIIGAKNFTENFILAELAKQLLESKGFKIKNKTGVGSTVARKALEVGQIDLYYEYTGTAYSVFHKGEDLNIMRDKDKLYKWLKENDQKKGLIWLKPLNINNTYTLMIQKKTSEKLKIISISDLKKYMSKINKPLSMAIDAEFYNRPDGFQVLSDYYNFDKNKYIVRIMDPGLTYLSLVKGLVDVAMGFSTDGRITYFNFINLIDNKNFFPVYNPAPVLRKNTLETYPEVENILNILVKVITLEAIRNLNYKSDVLHKPINRICRKFLLDKKLIR